MPVVVNRKDIEGLLKAPGLPPNINPIMILHGSEEVTIHKPIKPDVTYKVQEKILDIQDKGKLTVIIG